MVPWQELPGTGTSTQIKPSSGRLRPLKALTPRPHGNTRDIDKRASAQTISWLAQQTMLHITTWSRISILGIFSLLRNSMHNYNYLPHWMTSLLSWDVQGALFLFASQRCGVKTSLHVWERRMIFLGSAEGSDMNLRTHQNSGSLPGIPPIRPYCILSLFLQEHSYSMIYFSKNFTQLAKSVTLDNVLIFSGPSPLQKMRGGIPPALICYNNRTCHVQNMTQHSAQGKSCSSLSRSFL